MGRRRQCARGSEGRGLGGSNATIEGGEEAAARIWRALRRRQRQRGSGGRGVGGGSAALEGGEEAAVRLQRAGRRRQRGSGARAGSRLQHCSGGRRGGSQMKRRVRHFFKRRETVCVVQHYRVEAAVRS